jgi:hypothetical protein
MCSLCRRRAFELNPCGLDRLSKPPDEAGDTIVYIGMEAHDSRRDVDQIRANSIALINRAIQSMQRFIALPDQHISVP